MEISYYRYDKFEKGIIRIENRLKWDGGEGEG
jgi:hypothetical protein